MMSFRRTLLLSGTFLACTCLPASAALITFTTRAGFNGAAPGLPVETFEAGLVAPASVTTCNGPLSSAAASTCFAAGALLPGAVYNASGTLQPNMVTLGANISTVGNTSKVVGPNSFADTFNLVFANANAIGLDVFAGPASGNVAFSIFDSANSPLGTFTIAVPLGGAFFGVVSTTDLIGRVNVASQAALPAELVDNVAFGRTTTVPEPGSVLLLGAGIALGWTSRFRFKRTRANAP
jgi:hypothetical protein